MYISLVCVCVLLVLQQTTAAKNQGCAIHSQCDEEQMCWGGQCWDVCRKNTCGVNMVCQVVNHRAKCYCKPGYNKDPHYSGCSKGQSCWTNNRWSCLESQSCSGGFCQDLCNVLPYPCGQNTDCVTRNHEVTCSCKPGFLPLQGSKNCVQSCMTNEQCPSHLTCWNRVCQDFCLTHPNPCGLNTRWCVTVNHEPRCPCNPGFAAQPPGSRDCLPVPAQSCSFDYQCPASQKCEDGMCQDPCQRPGGANPCGQNSECVVNNHVLTCPCNPGFNRTPGSWECRPPSDPTAQQEMAAQPSVTIAPPSQTEGGNQLNMNKPPAAQQVMTVQPFSTIAPPLQTEGGHQQNVINPQGCSQDYMCRDYQVCEGGVCQDLCQTRPQVCGQNTECVITEHLVKCPCKPGFNLTVNARDCSPSDQPRSTDNGGTGAGTTDVETTSEQGLGYPEPPPSPGPPQPTRCSQDNQCANNELCFNYLCKDTCENSWSKCGPNSTCVAKDHGYTCECLPDHVPVSRGSAAGCQPVECNINKQCRQGFRCTTDFRCEEIPDPCINKCGPQAVCTRVSDSEARCACPTDRPFIGDPYSRRVGCTPACQSHEECALNEVCSRITGKCEDACVSVRPTCGTNSKCVIGNHAASCQCDTSHVWNNPDNTMAGCKKVCWSDNQCKGTRSCLEPGVSWCLDPCAKNSPCGPNTSCSTRNHQPQCQCDFDHTWNDPSNTKLGCRKMECNKNRRCRQGYRCTTDFRCEEIPDPCKNKCGPKAVCTRVSDYEATCACPTDRPFIGNPDDRRVGCIPVQCNEEFPCGRTQNCVEHKCVDKPCEELCGRNTECFVADSDNALCGCQTGYSGNPYSKAGCPHVTTGANFIKCFSENPDRPSPECVEYSKNHPKDKKFHFVTEEASWYEAQKHCMTEGKILAVIENDQEMTTIGNAVVDQGHNRKRFWVAGSNLKTEKRYQWVVGGTFTSMLYTNWNEHEPPAGQPRRCVALSPFQWVTEPQCDLQLPYICQDV